MIDPIGDDSKKLCGCLFSVRRETNCHLRNFTLVKISAFLNCEASAGEILHLVSAKRSVKHLGVQSGDISVVEDDNVIGVDIEPVRRKIR